MSNERQKNQRKLAFDEEYRGEAPKSLSRGTESLPANRVTESPAIGRTVDGGSLQAGKTASYAVARQTRKIGVVYRNFCKIVSEHDAPTNEFCWLRRA